MHRKALEIIYTTFMLPILEYGIVILDNCTYQVKQKLDNIHHEAAIN